MGGMLQGAPWRAKPKSSAPKRAAPAHGASAGPGAAGDPPPSTDESLRGLCVSDSVCGMFAEIKPPSPRA